MGGGFIARKLSSAAALTALTVLVACGGREAPLEGQRFGTRVPLAVSLPNEAGEFPVLASAEADRSEPINLPPAERLSAWTQRGATPENLLPHAALGGALQEIWVADIGQGNTRRARITADPVGGDGRIFTLDAGGQIVATSTAGARLWSADLTAGFDRGGGLSGGGLALSAGTVYATTGYGELIALDAASGAIAWRQRLDAAITTPTVVGSTVYVVSRDGAAWAIDAGNGRIRWSLPGTPASAVLAGGAAPAVSARSVIFPFGTGEVVAALRESGVRVWGTTVAGSRAGVAYASLNDITGDPVIVGSTIYAGNQSGRVVALEAASGARLWTATEGAYSPLLPVAGSIFFVSDRNELLRIEADTGARIWGTELPLFVANRESRRRAVFTHFGPILAGGQLIVASGDGAIRFFDPESGAETGQLALRGGAAANPIVIDDTLYVVSEGGRLHAFR
ncbi:MAG: PQQ-binding-like beta-propeller repeat protein [Pseudomonadota bacterium]